MGVKNAPQQTGNAGRNVMRTWDCTFRKSLKEELLTDNERNTMRGGIMFLPALGFRSFSLVLILLLSSFVFY